MASAAAAEEISYKKVGEYLIDTDIDRALGSTYGSQVFAGKHAKSGEKVAAKLITWGKSGPHDMIDDEVKLMRKLPPHENTVKFYEYIKKDMGDSFQLWIMLEKCDLGDLEKFSTARQLNVKQTLDLFLQAAKGLQHIHDNKLVHRDIKLGNLLVHGSKDNPVVKIADFGISRMMEKTSTNMTTLGTPSYQAPEMFKGGKGGKTKAGKEVDTFSLAVSILSLLDPQDASKTTVYKVDGEPLGEYLHRHPNTNVSALINKARDTEDVRRIKQVLAAMLAPAAADRPTMEQVVAQLSHLHSTLCMKYLLAYNTAWESPRLLTDEDNLHDVSTAIRAQKVKPGSDGAAATHPYDSAAGLQGVNQQSKETIFDLLGGSADGKKRVVQKLPRGKKEEEIVDDRWEKMVTVDTFEEHGVWILDDKGGWVKQAAVPKECRVKCTCICGIPGGFVVLGGRDYENNKVTSKCWIFSYSNKQWKKTNMSNPRSSVAAALVGHIVYAFGGCDDKGNVLTVVEKLYIQTTQWSDAKSMPCAMDLPRIAAAGEFVYIKDCHSRDFFSYDTRNNTYTSLAVSDFVPEELNRHCMISHSNKLYLLGGEDERVAIQYDLRTKSWQQLTPPRARYPWGCYAITRGNAILLCGGCTEGEYERNIVEKYDVTTDAWGQLEVRLPFEFRENHCRVFNYMK